MKQITAFECEHCGRILKTKPAMRAHELRCFVNPESKSCITCKNMVVQNCINGVPLTEKQQLILEGKVEGTYTVRSGGNEECDYNELNEEYRYLENCDCDNFCNSLKCVLKKLRTQCSKHVVK